MKEGSHICANHDHLGNKDFSLYLYFLSFGLYTIIYNIFTNVLNNIYVLLFCINYILYIIYVYILSGFFHFPNLGGLVVVKLFIFFPQTSQNTKT